jgi:hypothetical protein
VTAAQELEQLDAISRTRALSTAESNRLFTLTRSMDRMRIRAQAAAPARRARA